MKTFYQRFLLFSRAKQIALLVVFVHLAILFALVFHHLITLQWRTPKPMLVKTVSLAKPAPALVTAAPSKPTPKPALPSPKTKTTKSTSPPTTAKTQAWKDIAESLNTIAAEPKKSLPALHVPTKAAAATQAPPPEAEEISYGEYLTAFLQNTLELPEYGDVKIKIEIDGFGQFVDCQILDSKSPKNASFLKETLPTLHFPAPQLGPFESTKILSIMFRNR